MKTKDGTQLLGHVHPGYEVMWEEMQQEEDDALPTRRASGTRKENLKPLLPTVKNIAVIACVLGTLAMSSLAYLEKEPREKSHTPEALDSLVDSRFAKSDREMELVKGILSGLVEALSKMETKSFDSADADTHSSDPAERGRVTVALAHLRSAPRKDAPSVALVPKDTVLLITGTMEGWTQVQSPIGTDAWISNDVIERQREGA